MREVILTLSLSKGEFVEGLERALVAAYLFCYSLGLDKAHSCRESL